jgi:hypothetical protein
VLDAEVVDRGPVPEFDDANPIWIRDQKVGGDRMQAKQVRNDSAVARATHTLNVRSSAQCVLCPLWQVCGPGHLGQVCVPGQGPRVRLIA